MQDPVLMGVVHCLHDRHSQERRGSRVLGQSPETVFQAAAFHQLHAEVRQATHLADFVDRHDVGVLELGGVLGLAQETAQVGGTRPVAEPDHFHRDDPIQALLPGFVDDPHPAAGDGLEQIVVAERAG